MLRLALLCNGPWPHQLSQLSLSPLRHHFDVIPFAPSDPAIKPNGARSSAMECFSFQQTGVFAVKIHDISLAWMIELDQCFCWCVLQKY